MGHLIHRPGPFAASHTNAGLQYHLNTSTSIALAAVTKLWSTGTSCIVPLVQACTNAIVEYRSNTGT
jgi:hypothetical protein